MQHKRVCNLKITCSSNPAAFRNQIKRTCMANGKAKIGVWLNRRPLLRIIARTDPSVTLSPSADFPGMPVILPTLLRRFRDGRRRVSPVAQRVLVTVLPLPPRRSGESYQPAYDLSYCLHLTVVGSASGAFDFRGHPCVRLRCGPVTRNHPLR
jgi:hypothetical protein